MAYLMRMAVDYGRSIGFTGDFYIEPKPKEPTKHQYDFDVSTVLAFLRKYDLDKDFKMNIEANHATLAGHTFQHELRVARDNGVFRFNRRQSRRYALGLGHRPISYGFIQHNNVYVRGFEKRWFYQRRT